MATAWNGADPVENVDPGDYELGVVYRCDADLTISHLRVWTGSGENTFTNRKGKVWSSVGGILADVTLPDDLPTGWSTHALSVPLEINAATTIMVSYSTGGDYGALAGGLNSSVTSADGQVVALAAALSLGGRNGKFNTTPGQFPNNGVDSNPFYGADFVYTLGHGDNTPPVITGTTVTVADATVTVTISATDAETLTGATYRVDWGDGTFSTGPASVAQHTYTNSGTYDLLLSVTDAGDLSDFAARSVRVVVPSQAPLRPSYVFRDAEELIINYLRPRLAARSEPWLAGLKIGNKKPETSATMPVLDRVMWVRRIGGQPRTVNLDLARIDFKCYMKSEAEAHDLAALVRAMVQASVNHSGITTVTQFLGLTNVPDSVSNAPCYLFTMEFHIEGTPLV